MKTNITGNSEGIISALGQYGGASLIVLALVMALCAFIVWQQMKRQAVDSERSAQAQREILAVNKEVSKDFKDTVEFLTKEHSAESKEMRQESKDMLREFREMQRENHAFISDLSKSK